MAVRRCPSPPPSARMRRRTYVTCCRTPREWCYRCVRCMYVCFTNYFRYIGYAMLGILTGSLLPISAFVYYTTAKILCVIVRTHHQMTSQVTSISDFTDNTRSASVTLKAICSVRNVLIICLAFLSITLRFDIYSIDYMVEQENKFPTSYVFVSFWIYVSNSSVNRLLYLVLFRFLLSKVGEMMSNCCPCLSCDRL